MDDSVEKKPISNDNLSSKGKISDKILLDKDINTQIKNIDHSRENSISISCKNTVENIQVVVKPKKKKKKKKNRCCHKECKKKLGLIDWNCKCGLKFCAKHRFPCDHSCTYDWHKDKKDILDRELMSAKSDFKKIDIL